MYVYCSVNDGYYMCVMYMHVVCTLVIYSYIVHEHMHIAIALIHILISYHILHYNTYISSLYYIYLTHVYSWKISFAGFLLCLALALMVNWLV